MDEELTTPGARVRWLRMGQDMTQACLAAKVFVGQTTISQVERDLWVPRPVVRRAIAEALNVHESFIWQTGDLARMRKRVAA
jgi:transcriptional regulator with XRE-family HTH domain